MEYSPRILPWQDWAEWTETYNWLFAPDHTRRLQGVDRVKAWRARGRLPVAVDATASLLEVALLEAGVGNENGNGGQGQGQQQQQQQRSAFELRSMYSIVIIRAINGLVEGLQTKFYAEPVNAIAARLGIAQWLVDLRHEATHSQLPSLASLRMGAQHLLDWLFREYWEKQAQDLEQAAMGAVAMLASYKAVALAAQEESPNALSRACKEENNGGGNGSSSTSSSTSAAAALRQTPSDIKLAEALDGLLNSVTASFVSAFLLPALVRDGGGGGEREEQGQEKGEEKKGEGGLARQEAFLLPDHELEALGGTTAGIASAAVAIPNHIHVNKHRQLYAPLLVRLQRRFPGFANGLFLSLAAVTQRGEATAAAGAVAAGAGEGKEGGGEEGERRRRGAPTYKSWLTYLQSRDWHSHFSYGRHEALFTLRRAPGIQFNLRDKPPENWTSAETDFMQAPASEAVLREGLGVVVSLAVTSTHTATPAAFEQQEERGGEREEGWRKCEAWVPCPIGGPVFHTAPQTNKRKATS